MEQRRGRNTELRMGINKVHVLWVGTDSWNLKKKNNNMGMVKVWLVVGTCVHTKKKKKKRFEDISHNSNLKVRVAIINLIISVINCLIFFLLY